MLAPQGHGYSYVVVARRTQGFTERYYFFSITVYAKDNGYTIAIS